MALTPKKLLALRLARRHTYVRTAHFKPEFIRHGLLKKDDDSAVTRGVLRQLTEAGLLRRYEPKMRATDTGGLPPIFVLTVKGSEALAQEMNDCSLLLPSEPTFRDWLSLNHSCSLTSLHLITDEAFERQSYVRLNSLHYEHETVRSGSDDPATKYLLYTVVSENPRIPCCPDSAMEIELQGVRRVLYSEFETGAEGSPARIAAKKFKGWHGMGSRQLFKKAFPNAGDMKVIAYCPYESFMHNLRNELKNRLGAEYWLFCDINKVNPQSFLHGEIFYSVDKGPFPLVKPPVPGTVPGEEGREERREEQRR